MITILLVDDDQLYRRAIRRVFVSWGWIVKEAEDGVEAMKIVEFNDKLDIVISDLDMPNMNGIELRLKLKSNNPKIPFLLMSGGYTRIGDIKDFIPKPSEVNIIRKKVEEMINAIKKHNE